MVIADSKIISIALFLEEPRKFEIFAAISFSVANGPLPRT